MLTDECSGVRFRLRDANSFSFMSFTVRFTPPYLVGPKSSEKGYRRGLP